MMYYDWSILSIPSTSMVDFGRNNHQKTEKESEEIRRHNLKKNLPMGSNAYLLGCTIFPNNIIGHGIKAGNIAC
jgi:hypothetical protein